MLHTKATLLKICDIDKWLLHWVKCCKRKISSCRNVVKIQWDKFTKGVKRDEKRKIFFSAGVC